MGQLFNGHPRCPNSMLYEEFDIDIVYFTAIEPLIYRARTCYKTDNSVRQ